MRFLLFICLICSSLSIYGHGNDTIKRTDFYKEIKNYDLSQLWCGDSMISYKEAAAGNEDTAYKRPEPLGFIGDSFQRFYIHYTSVIKNPDNPYEYIVKGKTRVKNNICSFHGTIKVKDADTNHDDEFLQGTVVCDILFYEDSGQTNSGFFKGVLKSEFFLDTRGKLRYNILCAICDSYSNNQCVGTWTSYKTKITKRCNWGDFRIPDSYGFGQGDGEFEPSPKYYKFGWDDYQHPIFESEKTVKKEKEQWWK